MNAIRQRGFAAVAAILTAAIVASVATFLIWQAQLAVRQSENIADARQGDVLARALVATAAGVISRDEAQVDYAGEPWGRGLMPVEEGESRATGVIEDAQARFNVNSLAGGNEAAINAFRRLLGTRGVPTMLADAVVDWMDADDVPIEPAGAEDLYYLGLDPPYRTANRPIADIAELRLVKGMTDAHFARIAPLITALPAAAKLNVNTASADVLAAVLPGFSAADAKSLVAARMREPIRSKTEFPKRLPASVMEAANELLDVRTDHFEVHGVVKSGRVTTGYRALVVRDGPAVVSFGREFG